MVARPTPTRRPGCTPSSPRPRASSSTSSSTRPAQRIAGNELAARLHLAKGAHGVAGLLAWPGRYTRKLGRVFPIATEGRADGGTDYFMDPAIAALFAQARDRAR